MEQPNQNLEPQTGRLYSGKAPLVLQLIGGLMWISGLDMILGGIFLILFYGLGIIYIILGVLTIKYAKAVFKMKREAYKGTLIIQSTALIAALILWGGKGGFGNVNWTHILTISVAIFSCLAIYFYRNQFINN